MSVAGPSSAALAKALPATLLLTATLAGVLPWGALPWAALAGGEQQAISAGVMMPLAVMHACSRDRSLQLPAGIVFLAGLLADALTAGPLGYWPLIYLLSSSLSRWRAAHLPSASLPVEWGLFAVGSLVIAGAAWAISSIYQLSVIAMWGLAQPVLLTVIVFPVVALALTHLMRWVTGAAAYRPAASE